MKLMIFHIFVVLSAGAVAVAHLRRLIRHNHMELKAMAVDLSRLVQEVQDIKGVVPSAVAAFTALKDQVAALQEQVANGAGQAELQAQVDALAADLDAAVQPLAQAIAANPEPEQPAQ